MKFKPLIFSLAALYCLSFQCDSRCDSLFYGVVFQVSSTDSLKLFDSVLNNTEQAIVWKRSWTPTSSDTLYGSLPWNPEKQQTLYVFYSAKAVDSLIVNYSYDAEYDSSCDRYYFYLDYATVEYSTFSRMDFSTGNNPYAIVELH